MSMNHSWIGPCAACAYCILVGGSGGWWWVVGGSGGWWWVVVVVGRGGCAPTRATDGPTGTGTRQDGRMDG